MSGYVISGDNVSRHFHLRTYIQYIRTCTVNVYVVECLCEVVCVYSICMVV